MPMVILADRHTNTQTRRHISNFLSFSFLAFIFALGFYLRHRVILKKIFIFMIYFRTCTYLQLKGNLDIYACFIDSFVLSFFSILFSLMNEILNPNLS